MRLSILLLVAGALLLTLASGVALAESVTCDYAPPCYGTPEDDGITGTLNGETIKALGGNDIVAAGDGDDTVYGGEGDDINLWGEGDSDTVYGNGGNDKIEADFHDTLDSTDHSYGGGGNDHIYAIDGHVDIIDCGKGTADYVEYDAAIDTVRGCETKVTL